MNDAAWLHVVVEVACCRLHNKRQQMAQTPSRLSVGPGCLLEILAAATETQANFASQPTSQFVGDDKFAPLLTVSVSLSGSEATTPVYMTDRAIVF